MQQTSFFAEPAAHIDSLWGDDVAAMNFTFYKDELHTVEQEIMLAVNERLYHRQLISEDAYTRAKAAILSS